MYEIKKPIPGFENVTKAEFKELSDNFAALNLDNHTIALINPYSIIPDYEFEVPSDVKVLLDIDENNPPMVYCPLVKQEPKSESIVNLKAPFLFNPKNKTMAQVILDGYGYVPLKDYIKE